VIGDQKMGILKGFKALTEGRGWKPWVWFIWDIAWL